MVIGGGPVGSAPVGAAEHVHTFFRYWQFFVALEEALERATRYVEFSNENYETHSVEFSRILLAAGSEVDVICKIMFEYFGGKRVQRSNIDDYPRFITQRFPDCRDALARQRVLQVRADGFTVHVERHGLAVHRVHHMRRESETRIVAGADAGYAEREHGDGRSFGVRFGFWAAT